MSHPVKRQRTIFIKNWIIDAGIGIHAHEQNKKQRIRLNITFFQDDMVPFISKKIGDVVDYEVHKNKIQAIIDLKHEPLVETLADRIAQSCLDDKMVNRVIIELEKLVILPGTESCGVIIERQQGDY
ncbi:MAG: dihydroneopterin aldolase [Alphaproteobacteria bacterium]|nr:dihydroneopterin aldolase [Alphaproteobacteria bacterium]